MSEINREVKIKIFCIFSLLMLILFAYILLTTPITKLFPWSNINHTESMITPFIRNFGGK